MSSLCPLTPGFQFCLSQLQKSSSNSNNSNRQQQETQPDCRSFGVASNFDCCQHPTPTSNQRKESESGHSADTRSRNTSFMISLMEICNKMILPMAALQQDCVTCDPAADADPIADASASVDAHPLEDSAGSRLTTPSSCSSSSCHHCGIHRGHPLQQVNQNHQQQHQVNHQQQHQQHKAMRGVGSGRVGRIRESNNANSARYSTYCPGQASPDSAAEAAAAAEAAVAEATGEAERKVEAKSLDRRPLLTRSNGVPYWNVSEFQDFRAAAMCTSTHVFEPMLVPGLHRHAIILDSHRRLKAAIAGFRAPVYRPY